MARTEIQNVQTKLSTDALLERGFVDPCEYLHLHSLRQIMASAEPTASDRISKVSGATAEDKTGRDDDDDFCFKKNKAEDDGSNLNPLESATKKGDDDATWVIVDQSSKSLNAALDDHKPLKRRQILVTDRRVFKTKESCPFKNVCCSLSGAFTSGCVDYSGGVLALEDHGVKLTIPIGAVSYGDAVDIEIASSLYGPFIIPKGYRPISTFVWIGACYKFKRELQVKIEHHAHVACREDLSQLFVLKTCKTCKNQALHEVPANNYKYDIDDSSCTYSSDNFCSVCLVAKSSNIPDRVMVYQFVPKNYATLDNFPAEVLFCYDSTVCKIMAREQLKKRNMIVNKSVIIPYPVKRDDKLSLSNLEVIGKWKAHPNKRTICATDLQCYDLKDIEARQKEGSYPPRFCIYVSCLRDSTLYLSYEIIVRERSLQFNICRCPWSWYYTVIDESSMCCFSLLIRKQSEDVDESAILATKPSMANVVKIVIPKIRGYWEEVGYSLGFDITFITNLGMQFSPDCRKCCLHLLENWLQHQGHDPKTWSQLVDAIGNVNGLYAAAEEIKASLEQVCAYCWLEWVINSFKQVYAVHSKHSIFILFIRTLLFN